jgi:hypothetical protein
VNTTSDRFGNPQLVDRQVVLARAPHDDEVRLIRARSKVAARPRAGE